jgi:HlyD family secretion protein
MMIRHRLWVTVIAIMAITLGVVGCNTGSSPGSAATTPAPSGPAVALPEVVSAEAVVVPYKDADVSFNVAGRVQEVLVSEGETVTAGQELVRLETRDLELGVRRAQAGLASAQAQLARAKGGARSEEIALAEADVAIAEANVESAKAGLSSAQAALNSVLAGASQRDIEIAEKQVELAKNQLWGAQAQRDVIGDAMNSFPPRASNIEYEAAKAQVAAAETQVQIAELQLEQAKAGAGDEDITAAKAQVAQAQAGVEIAEAQLEQAQAGLDLVKAGSLPEDIAVAEAAVAQAEVGLEEIQNALEDAVLKAPFDGTVGAVMFEEGELVSPQVPVVRLGDLTRLRVLTSDLSEADVNRVELGQEATITVDALEGKTFNGRVARIASLATERRGDRVYAVTLDLDVGPESGLRWGMSAFVEITVD